MINFLLTILLFNQPIANEVINWTIAGDLNQKNLYEASHNNATLDKWATKTLRNGDIISRKGSVVVAGVMDFSDYVSKITASYYSHCGIVWLFGGQAYVFEMRPEGTARVSLELFLQESVGRRVLVQRVKDKYKKCIPAVMDFVWTQYLGNTGFDFDFRLGNGKLYCAEMIVESFKTSRILLAKPVKAGDLPGITDHILKTFTVVGGSYFFSKKPFDANMTIFTVGDIIKSKHLDKVFEGEL